MTRQELETLLTEFAGMLVLRSDPDGTFMAIVETGRGTWRASASNLDEAIRSAFRLYRSSVGR